MAIGSQEIVIFLIPVIIIALIIWFLSRGRQQQQQQQQVIIQGEAQGKKRVCPKCGWQNDKDVKFCGDCGFKFNQ
ncbi:MAG TPA: zinc-ribbon domain-containing protein [Candidatus Wunengus sp. YC60]|uniref:zinc-ribbon domain-containing protein n=1 Tax=Candidatus Wunengus sp. YC60 TaxID=3367697 RepID=UPI0040279036